MTEHPDVEVLSAWLDGEAGEVAAHVEGCTACRARVAELRSVQEAISQPVVPPAAGVRDQAVARALAAMEETPAAGSAPSAPVAAGTPSPPPAAPATPAGERARLRWWLAGSGAAAAVLAIIVAFSTLVGRDTGRDTTTALSSGAADTSAQEAAPTGPPLAAGGEQVVSGGDLGDVADVGTLRARAGPAARAAAAAGATGGAPSPPLAPPPSAGTPTPRVVGTRVCEIEARTARPHVGVVVYAANLRFQGTPAVVLGFADPNAPDTPVTLLVLAPEEGCRLLAESTTP